MITLNHLVYDIMGIATSGSLPNEFKITTEQIEFWIEEVRAILISQSLSKKDDINDSWIQYIGCVELEQVDKSECCSVPTNCYILKSIKDIPSTIDTWKDNNIISITTIDGTMIPKSNPFKSKYQQYNKYTNNNRSWYLKNDKLYVINDQVLKYVNIAGLFEHPSDLSNFVNCANESCFTSDSDYPVSASIASQITDYVIKTKVLPYMQFPSDNINDAANVIQQPEKKKK